MSFSTTAIKYGWVYLTALGVITGTTIYVASNTRHQVKPEDIIEIVLGVHERCLATQITTNPTYSVDPPSIVRTWTDTNGASIIVTNTIGWHTDRAMMVELDAKIKALIPYYVDLDKSSDTNWVSLTVTGLWAKLQIGDKTNKFTSTPAIGTNAATYGGLPYRIYEADLVERYKVLNALSHMYRAATLDSLTKYGGANGGGNPDHRSDVTWMKNAAEISYTASTPYTSTTFYVYSRILRIWRSPYGSQEAWYDTTLERTAGDLTVTNIPVIPDVTHTWELYLVAEGTTNWIPTFADTCNWDFDDHGDFTYAPVEGELSKVESGSASSDSSHSASFGSFGLPTWCTTPPVSTVNYRGYIARDYGFLINWQFNYCNTKYW